MRVRGGLGLRGGLLGLLPLGGSLLLQVVVLFQQSNNAPLSSSFSPFFFLSKRTHFLESKEAKKTFVRNMLRVGFRVFCLGTYLTP